MENKHKQVFIILFLHPQGITQTSFSKGEYDYINEIEPELDEYWELLINDINPDIATIDEVGQIYEALKDFNFSVENKKITFNI
jgi:hypothetical protein